MMPDALPLNQWRIDSGAEPVVRIGVVLAEDGTTATELRVPADAYELSDLDQAHPPQRIADARIQVRISNQGVKLTIGSHPPMVARRWRLAPLSPAPLKRGQGLFVRDVVAGRGFHWQTHVDQTLPGQVELLLGTHRAGATTQGAGAVLVLVNVLPLETYLAGVITAEMSGKCPVDFLRAQCITARSWLLARTQTTHPGQPFDCCNDDHCQRYQGTGDMSDNAIDAARSTRGKVLVTRDGRRVVDANYSKSCGGIVESATNVWGAPQPGLAPLVDAPAGSIVGRFMPVTDANIDEYLGGGWLEHCDAYCSPNVVPEAKLGQYLGRVDMSGHYFRWTVRYSHDELLDLLVRKLPEARGMKRLADLRVMHRGISGRATEIELELRDRDDHPRRLTVRDQYRIRQILHPTFLFSSAFAVRIERHRDGSIKSITLRGAGWGHGVGLCQIGALGMALQKIDSDKIVRHYYPEADLKRVYG